ncbi:hypothetical protein C0V73_18475 [Rhizobium sp. TH135]|nr:hypothetical protein C0V73_18475 [Rhizobium sp. TH135]
MEDGVEIKVDEDLARRAAHEVGIDLRHLIVLHAGFDRHRSIVRRLSAASGTGHDGNHLRRLSGMAVQNVVASNSH